MLHRLSFIMIKNFLDEIYFPFGLLFYRLCSLVKTVQERNKNHQYKVEQWATENTSLKIIPHRDESRRVLIHITLFSVLFDINPIV